MSPASNRLLFIGSGWYRKRMAMYRKRHYGRPRMVQSSQGLSPCLSHTSDLNGGRKEADMLFLSSCCPPKRNLHSTRVQEWWDHRWVTDSPLTSTHRSLARCYGRRRSRRLTRHKA